MSASADLSANTRELVAPTKRYSDTVAAVDDINLRVPKNSYCCLQGGGLRRNLYFAPSVVGIGMFGFMLSWDEMAHTSRGHG